MNEIMLCTRCKRTIDVLDPLAASWETAGEVDADGYIEATCAGCLTGEDQQAIFDDYDEPYMHEDEGMGHDRATQGDAT